MPASTPIVSVILPVYNARESVERAVTSILQQTLHEQIECVVIDDGSDDGSGEQLAQMPGIQLIRRPHQGLVAALQEGLAQSRGSFIARMDADDVSAPPRLEKQLAWLTKHPEVGLVSSLVEYGGERTSQAGYARHVDWCNQICEPHDISRQRFVESPLPHPSVMFRRSLLEACGSYREGSFPEDYDLWLRWLEQGVIMSKVPEVLLRWNDLPNRLSRNDPRYNTETFHEHKAPFLARWLEANNPHHPDIVVWGAGRVARRRAAALVPMGINIVAYIDIAPGKIGQRIDGIPVCSPEELPDPNQAFVVPYVGSRGAREQITQALEQRGYACGTNFICAS